jgi:hypothetical protein
METRRDCKRLFGTMSNFARKTRKSAIALADRPSASGIV